jgi:hypothetical protein
LLQIFGNLCLIFVSIFEIIFDSGVNYTQLVRD